MISEPKNIVSSLPVYLLMVSYGRKNFALDIINDYLDIEKPNTKTNLIVVENTEETNLSQAFNFFRYEDIFHLRYPKRNKASAINFAIRDKIQEKEALIICIDNDISFKNDYLTKYYNTAINQGRNFFFGTSFLVEYPQNYDKNLDPYLSGSALGMPDQQFIKMKKLMFLGFSYAFFKSQWQKVNGLDERFAPGSKYGLGADESIFQKKLVYEGFIPHLVKNNQVKHRTLPELYTFGNVRDRQENNGYTHGFQNLIISNQLLKANCVRRLFGLIKRCFVLYLQKDKMKFKMKYAYTKGFFKAFILYFKIDDRSNYLDY